MQVTSRTHVGNVRKINEDSLFFGKNSLGHVIICVADGLGGHNAGEVASKIAIDTVKEEFNKADYEDVKVFLANVINLSNEKIYTQSLTDEKYSKMGTTLSIGVIIGSYIYIGHVGDSRIYFYNYDFTKHYQLTTDHTVVQMLYEQGHLRKEELITHPYKNILAQSVGTASKISADIVEVKLPKSGYLFICSDGVTDELTDEEIISYLDSSEDLDQKADNILNSILNKTAKDNISFILVER